MILTGREIHNKLEIGNIQIDPFNPSYLEPNSYGFHLGEEILEYQTPVLDAKKENPSKFMTIPEDGLTLYPERFYLGHTLETIGSKNYATELYCNVSTAMCGIFIQTSAPLGHSGAIIKWTLEIVVAQPVILYPRMRIGKICFWKNLGSLMSYNGRYSGSQSVVASLICQDQY